MQKVKLKTGLRRGNIASVAGEVVEVQDGLAQRLVDRGMAELVTRGGKGKKVQADKKEDAPTAPKPEDTAPEAAAPEAPAAEGDAAP